MSFEIGGIKISLPKLGNVKENSNKPLANLNEPIKDSFTSSKLSTEDATKEVFDMADNKGNPRFSDSEVSEFKHAYSSNNIDLETVKTFKDNTKFDMNSMIDVYAMKRETKDKDFYSTVNTAIKKVPQNKVISKFKQNIFEPTKEFSLVSEKAGMDKLEQTLNKNFVTIGNEYKFNTKGDLVEESKGSVSITQGEHGLLIKKDEKNYVNNTESQQVQTLDKDGYPYVLTETVVKNDKDGNILRKEEMTPSKDIEGVYDVKYTYANGTTKEVSTSYVDKKTGIKTIKKDMKSANGTHTEYLYEDDPQGNRIMDYKITNKDGKILMRNSQTFEVIDDNHFVSSKNGYKYDISVDEKSMKIKDLHHDTETSIDFEKKCKGNKDELINLLKKVPGEELFETVDSIKKLKGKDKDKLLDSAYNKLTKNINIGDDLFVFLHELGHAKDGEHNKGIMDKLNGEKDMFKNDKSIQKTYLKERENFNKEHPESERQMIDYFTQAKGHYGGQWGGLAEVIAETNALTNTYTDSPVKCLGTRTQVLQQHFPETIAAVRQAMEYKNDIAAIEYYGT